MSIIRCQDCHVGTNHFGHFALMRELLPSMRKLVRFKKMLMTCALPALLTPCSESFLGCWAVSIRVARHNGLHGGMLACRVSRRASWLCPRMHTGGAMWTSRTFTGTSASTTPGPHTVRSSIPPLRRWDPCGHMVCVQHRVESGMMCRGIPDGQHSVCQGACAQGSRQQHKGLLIAPRCPVRMACASALDVRLAARRIQPS